MRAAAKDEDRAPSVVLERQRLAVDGVPSDPGQARLIHGAPIASVAVGVVLVLGRLSARRQSRPSADYDGRAMTTILITGGGRGLGRATAEKPAGANGVKRRFWELAAGLTGFDPLPHPGARA